MMDGISVVINTRNEENNLPGAIASVKDFASEVIVVDMESTDKTREIAKKLGAKVFNHKQVGYVEPARNFAISKANREWVFILDADEEIPDTLAKELKKIVKDPQADFYRLPRKNIIFGKWLKHSRWWPDHNIRFFKKGAVVWNEIIHAVPETRGVGEDLPDEEDLAIIHHHYVSLSQYLERTNRYTTIQAKLKVEDGYKFSWPDLISKPSNEFLSRFFFGEAYKDGVHGLAVSLLQAFTELVIHLKVWELEGSKSMEINRAEVETQFTRVESDLDHWLIDKKFRGPTIVRKLLRKIPR